MYDQSNKEICISSLRAPRHNAPKQPLPKRQLLASIVPQCCKEIEFVWKNAALSAATVGRQPCRGGQVGAAPQHPNLTSSPCCDSTAVSSGLPLAGSGQIPDFKPGLSRKNDTGAPFGCVYLRVAMSDLRTSRRGGGSFFWGGFLSVFCLGFGSDPFMYFFPFLS